ncbi:hypothetical protein ACIPSA_30540 [Streptomyces sp. NPDC086549]|uniref:hypothetical protein n=1 Tax=Streptomyces sp. NPDC086549 TaxID=3365752 RepID=UPI00381402ED
MTVTWRSAVLYALTVVVLSWLTGAAVDLAWQAASGHLGTWQSTWLKDPWNAVFVAAATASLTFARRLDKPLPRWRAVLVDAGIYLAVLLVISGISAGAAGDDAPADTAFVTAIIAVFTLQLPAAWLLTTWRSGHLQLVLSDIHTESTSRNVTSR